MGQAIRDKNEREKTFALIFKWEGGELVVDLINYQNTDLLACL